MGSSVTLRTLGEEPFGHQVYRARKASGMDLRDAAELVSRFIFVSHATLHRLERLDRPPEDRRRRAIACLAVMAYGFDPVQFGLSVDDLPKGIPVDGLVEELVFSDLVDRQLGCLYEPAA